MLCISRCRGTHAGSFATSESVVVTTREVLVPVPLRPLEELQVVLHFAFDEGFDGYGAFDAVFREGICEVRESSGQRNISIARRGSRGWLSTGQTYSEVF